MLKPFDFEDLGGEEGSWRTAEYVVCSAYWVESGEMERWVVVETSSIVNELSVLVDSREKRWTLGLLT